MSWHQYAFEIEKCFNVNGTPLFTADRIEADTKTIFRKR